VTIIDNAVYVDGLRTADPDSLDEMCWNVFGDVFGEGLKKV
jgi:phage tail protein X